MRGNERASERKNEAPLDCARQRRINPLAGARRGFCARRRRADVNVKRSSRAVGKDSHARVKTRWPLKYNAFLHPAQFDSVHSVEGHWFFFSCAGASKGRQKTLTHEQFDLICYCLQSLLCVILSSSPLRLSSKSLPHCTARLFIFLAVTVFPELYGRKCSWAGRLCRCDDDTVAHFGPFLFSIFTFFSQSPWSWKKQLRMCTFRRID